MPIFRKTPMPNCEQLFLAMGIVFPNRMRAMFVNGSLTGLAGPYSYEMLDQFGTRIASSCPTHAAFGKPRGGQPMRMAATRQLVPLPPHPDIVVRFVHFDHDPQSPCEMIALAAGPVDTIDLLPDPRLTAMPLSRREMRLTLDLAAGRTLQQVADRDGLSINTVRNQVKNAMKATNTHSQAHLASIVRDWLL